MCKNYKLCNEQWKIHKVATSSRGKLMTSICMWTSSFTTALCRVISQNIERVQNSHPSGQNLGTSSLPRPLLGRTWGKWGITLIGALTLAITMILFGRLGVKSSCQWSSCIVTIIIILVLCALIHRNVITLVDYLTFDLGKLAVDMEMPPDREFPFLLHACYMHYTLSSSVD